MQNPYLVVRDEPLKALGWNGTGEKADFLEKLGYPRGSAVASYCGRDPDRCQVRPARAVAFLAREPAPGLFLAGPAVRAFTSRGFEWGGVWRDKVDYQHMEVKPGTLH